MLRMRLPLLLLPLLAGLAAAAAPAAGKAAAAAPWRDVWSKLEGRPASVDPEFCVIVRTYWGHGKRAGDAGLRRLLRSLQRQTVQSWQAVLLVLDSRPFEDLHHIVAGMEDDRIWVFAEWIEGQFRPRKGGEWAPGYHGTLYNLTDDAIQVCPPSTRWLVVTNGDNEYAEHYFQLVKDAGAAGADLVAADFYSRYTRLTAPSCDRFAAAPGAPACKANRLRWCHTDLGANALSYPRFQKEGRRFGGLASVAGGLDAEHYDGVMMQALMAAGWAVTHLEGVCPFNHAPSFQSCGWGGGVWDDRDVVTWATAGGRCITPAEAERILAGEPDTVEVTIAAASDGNVTAYEGVTPEQLQVRCLRKRHYLRDDVLGRAVAFFNKLCVDDYDLPAFKEWQRAAAEAEEAADAAGGGGGKGGGGKSSGSGDVAARAAATAAKEQEGARQESDDFWALQEEFYRETGKGGAAAGDDTPAATELR